jgi:ParB family chromosome partitioning protein
MRDKGSILWLDPRALIEDPENVRHDTPDLEGLADSIRQYGVLQPLGVARHADRFHVVYGTRRRRAAIMAGLEHVPCVELSGDRLVCQLLENLHRVDLNDMEKAEGFARLKEQLSLGRRDLSETKLDELTARTLGVSPSTVRRYLRLRELPTGVRALLRNGELTVTQAQHLFALQDGARQEEVARSAAEKGLSAASVARACGLLAARPGLSVDAALAAAEGRAPGPDRARDGEGPGVPGQTAPGSPTPGAPKLAPRPKIEEGIDEDRELWGDEAVTDDDIERAARARKRSAVESAFADTLTADGNRVLRIHTVDAFCDEVARIARCVSEGDLARAIERDPKAAIKLDLAGRQVQYVLGALAELAAEAVPA